MLLNILGRRRQREEPGKMCLRISNVFATLPILLNFFGFQGNAGGFEIHLMVLFPKPIIVLLFFQVSFADRETVARLRNCVVALAEHTVLLFDTSLIYAHEASLKYSVSTQSSVRLVSHCWFATAPMYTTIRCCAKNRSGVRPRCQPLSYFIHTEI